ncbi:MAG: fused response regulator/phosphatase, partial [Armatimonadota bacterium]|nr:fused response regulator/phosphatase [Armatimonadota bacterium]
MEINKSSNQPKRILIVDDEEINRELLESLVEMFGHESVMARDGQEALAKLTPDIDLVLLDAMMPGMNGFEVARRIRADAEMGQTPIIMATALTGKEDRLRAVEAGANDFITKPIDRTELRVRMTSLLKMKEALDGIKRHQEELRRKNTEMEADLNLAREFQMAFLPQPHLSLPRAVGAAGSPLRFYNRYYPTSTVGGDFTHLHILSDTMAAVFICDVMGHGVRSALVTAILRGLVEELTPLARDPGQFLTALNSSLITIFERTRATMFASAFYMVVDVTTGWVCYANAGHPNPFHVRRSAGEVEPLPFPDDKLGPALGVFENTSYAVCERALADNDLVVVFTDGLFEVVGADDDEYGEERLLASVRRHL